MSFVLCSVHKHSRQSFRRTVTGIGMHEIQQTKLNCFYGLLLPQINQSLTLGSKSMFVFSDVYLAPTNSGDKAKKVTTAPHGSTSIFFLPCYALRRTSSVTRKHF